MAQLLKSLARITDHQRASQVRLAGGVTSAQLVWGMLILSGRHGTLEQAFIEGVVAASWGVGCWAGVLWRRGTNDLATRRQPSWLGALCGGMALGGFATILILGVTALPRAMDAFSWGFVLCFVTAKVGCVLNGCCGAQLHLPGRGRLLSLRAFELAQIEIAANLAMACIAMAQWREPGDFALAYLGGHAALRVISKVLRSPNVTAAVTPKLALETVPAIFAIGLLQAA